jgi:hypothetical protein
MPGWWPPGRVGAIGDERYRAWGHRPVPAVNDRNLVAGPEEMRGDPRADEASAAKEGNAH